MSPVDKTMHTYMNDQPFVVLQAKEAFNGLTEKERSYAYYMSKASWVGGLITLIQTSLESPNIFILVHKYICAQPLKEIRENALNAGFTEDEVLSWFTYIAGFLANAGNYKGFGDSKIIPNIEQERVEGLLKLSPIWNDLESVWTLIREQMYDLAEDKLYLRFPPNGCTTYFINCVEEDSVKVLHWLKKQGIESYNMRCIKQETDGKVEYVIKFAGKLVKAIQKETVDGITYNICTGDYSELMGKVIDELKEAIPHVANETERKMLEAYCSSFQNGSLDDHKNGSRYWIQDKGPIVETYIGFIENYRDPAGVCAEFEGFVAAVNKEMSKKFQTLVDQAEVFLDLLPWSKEFEKDRFLRPDFTSLDIITYAGSGLPVGINIPNYDEIRQTEGFKNVSLGNVLASNMKQPKIPFLSESDVDLFQKYRQAGFEVQVGLHELLGHGSGKLFIKKADGTFNFADGLIDPITQKPVKYYEPGENYDSKFGALGSSYEECRAEAVGLYLSLEPDVVAIFGHNKDVMEDIMYTNWLATLWSGLFGLEVWNAKGGWSQAHCRARFALLKVAQESGCFTLKKVSVEGADSLSVTLDRNTYKTVGREAIKQFLFKLQVYKATADVEAAEAMYKKYTDVDEEAQEWRKIVLANKLPRKIHVQSNILEENGKLVMKEYDGSADGLLQSWIDRFDNCDELYAALKQSMDKF